MTGERVERRLAAILAADIAGYSRLMGADEEGTLARLKAIRKSLIDPTIAAHRGRIVKTTGDGLLVEFASAVEAARCAVDVQRGIAAQNVNISQEVRLHFRIGHRKDVEFDLKAGEVNRSWSVTSPRQASGNRPTCAATCWTGCRSTWCPRPGWCWTGCR